jgi:hypothetical protein
MLVATVLGLQLIPMIKCRHNTSELRSANKLVEALAGCMVTLEAWYATDMTAIHQTDSNSGHHTWRHKDDFRMFGYVA